MPCLCTNKQNMLSPRIYAYLRHQIILRIRKRAEISWTHTVIILNMKRKWKYIYIYIEYRVTELHLLDIIIKWKQAGINARQYQVERKISTGSKWRTKHHEFSQCNKDGFDFHLLGWTFNSKNSKQIQSIIILYQEAWLSMPAKLRDCF